jgi:tetratricopeptide (TPR) repeat protein
MLNRTCLLLVLLATAVSAEDSVRAAYKNAKRLKGKKQVEYAAEQAGAFESSVTGADLMYLGFLWQYAEQLEKADATLEKFLASGEGAKNRPLVMVKRAEILLDMRAWAKVTPVAELYFQQHPSHKYQAQMRFHWGRGLRMNGQIEDGLKQFTTSAKTGYIHAMPEVIDCLLQLGRYDEAVAEAQKKPDDSYSKAVIAAAGHFGKPLPKKLAFDFWTLKELAAAELREKPTVFLFWSTKARRSNEKIHAAGNGWVAQFGDAVNVVGPTVYAKFDPVNMRVVDAMTPKEEQGFVDSWAGQYNVKYPLTLMTDGALHAACGIDAERPTLPACLVSDKKGLVRYIRIGSAPWAFEGVEAMLVRVTKE